MAVPAAAGPALAANGEAVYKSACVACHGAGVAGAPKSGDKAAWSQRIAQGKPLLYEHAIRGYQGKAGVMPAKGGNAALADADVKSAVDYMIALTK
jgi:cytochrome c5